MHSRVAAVMAPCTHNRRVVTGSGGGRREGRESEPQRPHMSRHLFHFVLLLLLVMAFGGSGTANADDVQEPADPQFKWKGITEGGGVTVDSLGAPSLLKVGSDVFAVAEAQWKKDGVSFTGIASQLLTKKTANTPEEVLEKPEDQTQLLEGDGSESQNKRVDVSRPTTVLKGNDIYMLVGVYTNKVAAPRQVGASDAAQLGLLLVKGSVSGEDPSNNKIVWKDTASSPQKQFGTQLDSWTRLIGSGGSGVKIKDETLVFPVEGTKKKAEDADEDVKTVSLIISSSKDFTDWKLSKGMSADGCGSPSVVEWEGKLMMMTACDDGRRRVYEIGDKGEEWTEALGTLSRVWGNNKKVEIVRSGFITATIDGVEDNKKVMLVTLPVYAEEEDKNGKLHLWLTDNTHIVDIGPVSDDDAAASSLLYKSGTGDNDEEKLIVLYEKKGGDEGKPSPGMVSVLLTEQLQSVKEMLTTWKKADERVSQLCTSLIAQKDPPTDNDCDAVKITDGLVGFLSGKFSDGIWRDEYLGVNATLAENDAAAATGPSDGVKFTGRGAGAQWPVGKQGENQLYQFANYNFTLVATVSIDGEPEGNIPVMGVRVGSNGDENKVLLGLSYDSGRKWQVLCGDGNPKELGSIGETDTTQHVVILLRNGTQCTVYVDGQRVGDAQCELGSGESNDVSHFYIGGDGGSAEKRGDASVTVRNVLLYNRPWDDTEIGAFIPNKANVQVQLDRSAEGDAIQSSGGGKEEQGQSLGSSGAGGASTTAVSTITTPSAGGEESVMQVVSGSSSDGHKNVGGGFFSDGDPRVEAREEGTKGQEEEVNTQVREVNATAVSSNLGNVSQENNSDAGTVCESGLLPSLLLLLGLWGFAAL
ncbi:putative trans-sialidase, Group V [Trypanosoma cruzi]|uniref:Putative trans-sialidase, Group V n=1 Tax=Trypanosoma cruzi TaxID=5693 RepID=A0A2V2VB06_TRYCR|nr:putative trans-sialidase, Group V [Trypanosoma cruzi]